MRIPLGLRPALVLRLEHATGFITQDNQGREPLAHLRAIGLESRASVHQGFSLPADQLANGAVLVDVEAPLGDVSERRRSGNTSRDPFFLHGWLSIWFAWWKAADGGLELLCQAAVRSNAVAVATVQLVLAAPTPKDHLWTIEEVTVDGDLGTVDGEWRRLQPGRVHELGLRTGSALAEEQDVGDDGRALALKGIRRKPDGSQKSARSLRYSRTAAFCLSSVKWDVRRPSTPPDFSVSVDLAMK